MTVFGYDLNPDPSNLTQFKADIDLAVAAGAKVIRAGVTPWTMGGIWDGPTFSPTKTNGVENGQIIAQGFQYAQSKGLSVLLTVAQQQESDSWNDATTFVKNNIPYWQYLAKTLGPYIVGVQIWNEHDNANFMHSGQKAPTAASTDKFMTSSASQSYLKSFGSAFASAMSTFKTYASTVKVYTTITGYPADDSQETRLYAFYDGFASGGAKPDYTGWNAYFDANGDFSKLGPRLARIGVKYNRPLVIAEFGWPTEQNGAVSASKYASVIGPNVQAISSSTWVAYASKYDLINTGTTSTDPEQNFGDLDHSRNKRQPQYDATVAAIKSGNGSTPTPVQPAQSDVDFAKALRTFKTAEDSFQAAYTTFKAASDAFNTAMATWLSAKTL